MTQKNALKYLLDLTMLFIMIILMGYSVTGNTVHELLGAVMFALFATHCLLNQKWYKGSVKRMFSSKFKSSIRIWTITNYLTHVDFILLAVTSVLISNVLNLPVYNYGDFVFFHKILAYAGLVLVSTHTGVHAAQILSNVGRALGMSEKNTARSWVARFAALVIAALGIWSFVNRTFTADNNQIVPANSVVTQMSAPTQSIADYNTNLTLTYKNETTKLNVQTMSMTFNETVNPGETLNDFLGRLFCNGCSKHCSLLSPRCSKGADNAAAAQAYYESNASAETEAPTETPTEAAPTEAAAETPSESKSSATTEGRATTQPSTAQTTVPATQTEPSTAAQPVQTENTDNFGKVLFDYGTMSGAVMISAHYAMQYIRKKEKNAGRKK